MKKWNMEHTKKTKHYMLKNEEILEFLFMVLMGGPKTGEAGHVFIHRGSDSLKV